MKNNNTIPVQLFFNNAIQTEEFAAIMRKFLHAAVMLNFDDESQNYQEDIKNGYFWLNQLCDELEPQHKTQ
jgi:hypothetical protein